MTIEKALNQIHGSIKHIYLETEKSNLWDIIYSAIDEIEISDADYNLITVRENKSYVNWRRNYIFISKDQLASSLRYKYVDGMVKDHSIYKVEIDDYIVIGDIYRNIYKNGDSYEFNKMEYTLFKNESSKYITNNLLLKKILLLSGEVVLDISEYSEKEFVVTDVPDKIKGLYKIKETNVRKLLHYYDFNTDDLKGIVKELTDNSSTYNFSMFKELGNLKRFIDILIFEINTSLKFHNGILKFTHPDTFETNEVTVLEGDNLDAIIDHSLRKIRRETFNDNIEDGIIEIEFVSLKELTSTNKLVLTDTIEITTDRRPNTMVSDKVFYVEDNSDLSIVVISNRDTAYFTNICGITHEIKTIEGDITKAIIKMNGGNSKKLIIKECDFERYGIYTTFEGSLNSEMSRTSLDALKVNLEIKKIEANYNTMLITSENDLLSNKMNLITKITKLLNDTSSTKVAMQQLEREKLHLNNQLLETKNKKDNYEFGKTIFRDGLRLLI